MEKPSANKILLAIDVHQRSTLSLEYAIYFAKDTDTEIVILHVLEETAMLKRLFTSDEQRIKVYTEAKELLDKLLENIETGLGLPARTIIRYGKVYEQIIEVANEIKPKFVMVGKNDSLTLTRQILGSNTVHLIKESMYPIVTVRGQKYILDYENTPKNIVIPLDLTNECSEQITAAIEYGRFFGSKVHILTVQRSQSASLEIKLLTRLNRATKIIQKENVECSFELVKNTVTPVYKLVNKYARKVDARLIIIMTQQERDIVDYFIGKSAQMMLDNSEIPVLSVVPWIHTEDSVFSIFVDPLGIFDTKG